MSRKPLAIFVMAAVVALLSATKSQASILSRLSAGYFLNADITFEDDSREVIFDTDGSGSITGGDVLYGFVKVNQTSPPPVAGGNEVYGVFSQTFATGSFSAMAIGGGMRYAGSFVPTVGALSLTSLLPTAGVSGISASSLIAFVDAPGGFSADLATALLPAPGGTLMSSYLSLLDLEGTVRFTGGFGAGATNGDDYFDFETAVLGAVGGPADYVAALATLPSISTSFNLGTFSAGLTVLDVNFPITVAFNETIGNSFLTNNTGLTSTGTFELALTNGTFGGTQQSAGPPAVHVQDGFMDFINNADAVVNVTIPEPASVITWALLTSLGLAFGWFRRREQA